jgi:hypothetical protein
MCYFSLGEFKQCIKCLEEGKVLIAQVGVHGRQLETRLMNIEAELYQLKTAYSNRRHIQEVILHQSSAMLSPVDRAYALANIAFLDIITGADTNAVTCNLDAAMMVFQNGNYPRGISWCKSFYADLLYRE